MIEFYKNLREIRESKGLKKSEVADRLGIHRSAYGRMEATGKPQLTIERLYDLAKIFEMSPADIFNKSENGYDKDDKVLGLLRLNALTEPFSLIKKVENSFIEIYERQICDDILFMFTQRTRSFFSKRSKDNAIKDGKINEVIVRYKNSFNTRLPNRSDEYLEYLRGHYETYPEFNFSKVSDVLFDLEDVIDNFFSKELRIELSIEHLFLESVIQAHLYRDNILRETHKLIWIEVDPANVYTTP